VSRRAEHEIAEVLVDETVVDDSSGLASLHGPALAQETELVRERRHAHSEDEGDVADAEFIAADRQQMDDPRPRWIGERGEQIADGSGPVAPERSPKEWSNGVRVETLDGAGIDIDLGGKHLSHRSSIPCRS
jgi:hypothetical protein